MKQLETIVDEITSLLKETEYRKNRFSWYKVKDPLTVVLSIQKSQYDSDTWYYYFGICLHEIAGSNSKTISNCQIRYRVNNAADGVLLTAESIVHLLNRWDSMYGDLTQLRIHAIQGNLPIQSKVQAIRYLSSGDLSRFAKS